MDKKQFVPRLSWLLCCAAVPWSLSWLLLQFVNNCFVFRVEVILGAQFVGVGNRHWTLVGESLDVLRGQLPVWWQHGQPLSVVFFIGEQRVAAIQSVGNKLEGNISITSQLCLANNVLYLVFFEQLLRPTKDIAFKSFHINLKKEHICEKTHRQ